jgi:hypothetical protein
MLVISTAYKFVLVGLVVVIFVTRKSSIVIDPSSEPTTKGDVKPAGAVIWIVDAEANCVAKRNADITQKSIVPL